MTRVIVVGAGPTDVAPPVAVEEAVVVAADGGADRALAWDWPVHHLVGDLDSVTAHACEQVRRDGGTVHSHPPDKDETDLELALTVAADLAATAVDVVLDPGGRLDHLLVSFACLADARLDGMAVRAHTGESTIDVVRSTLTVDGSAGGLITLLPIGGPARTTTAGLRYPLDDEWLSPTEGRGLSNEMVAARVEVAVSAGVVLAIRPRAT